MMEGLNGLKIKSLIREIRSWSFRYLFRNFKLISKQTLYKFASNLIDRTEARISLLQNQDIIIIIAKTIIKPTTINLIENINYRLERETIKLIAVVMDTPIYWKTSSHKSNENLPKCDTILRYDNAWNNNLNVHINDPRNNVDESAHRGYDSLEDFPL